MLALRRFIGLMLLAPGLAYADSRPVNRPGMPLRPEPTEVRLVDGSRLHLSLNEQQIEVATPYGKLIIKLSDVQRIEFGTRLQPEVAGKAAAAVAQVRNADGAKREAGWKSLAGFERIRLPIARDARTRCGRGNSRQGRRTAFGSSQIGAREKAREN